MHHDLIIRNGDVIDGTGLPRRRADVVVDGERITKIGRLGPEETAEVEIDATGCVVAPGIVDIHTHYDPQITFDPYATMSCFHGVTTVLAGNCGFSAAPCRPQDLPAIKSIFGAVENMDATALDGVDWSRSATFAEFLEARRGHLGVNFACYIGHSNLRLLVLGDEASQRAATDAEVAEMRRLLAEALEAGAAGFSSSASPGQLDLEGRPVPSRLATDEELYALADEAGRHGHGSIGYLPRSLTGGLSDDDQERLIRLGELSALPVIIQGIGGKTKVDSPGAYWQAAKAFLDDSVSRGAPVYSMLIVQPFDRRFRIDADNHNYPAVPSWLALFQLPVGERAAAIADPERRAELLGAVDAYNRDPAAGNTSTPPSWDAVYVHEVADPANAALQSRSIAELAEERGVAPAAVMLDLAAAEGFATEFRWQTDTPEFNESVGVAQREPQMVIGVSDGGAHLGKDDNSDCFPYFLRRWVLDRKAWSLEEGIRQITHVPAALVGLHDRGLLRPGGYADVMVFDPDMIGPTTKVYEHDFPGGVGRYKAQSSGVRATIVNGTPIVLDGRLLDAKPGRVVAPGAGG